MTDAKATILFMSRTNTDRYLSADGLIVRRMFLFFRMFARVFDFNFDFAIKGLFETPAEVGGGGENSLPPLLF